MTDSHKELFERYVYAGAITRDPEALAALFTEDGVFEAPLVPAGGPLPGRLAGREAIRTGIGAFQQDGPGPVDPARSGYVLHDTTDPDVFIAEIDAVAGGVPMSLVQIFRVRDGLIAHLRDYFRP
ncbi:nuclear transport factor 2 family protein [Actinoplanes oblitus]|uniref:Nuclear transport factor 2 family protein n=1 Tax=Actinoplanes oblitus TaxID=3040509 RepID=A0ABY8WA88_9ACTN|nr:nuclear transport factor 2 family protein [Actinoplanes oblitus]WIM94051.1 nuclear transport factor 2 family protein [Actinoplanes oblitus]